MAEAEITDIKAKLEEMSQQIRLLLLPRDEADEKNAILEIRAGTGGDEAALFAGDLLPACTNATPTCTTAGS